MREAVEPTRRLSRGRGRGALLAIAVLAALLLGGSLVLLRSDASRGRSVSVGATGPASVDGAPPQETTQVPATLPPEGVDVNGQAVLRPAPDDLIPQVPEAEAVKVAGEADNGPGAKVTATQLVLFTNPTSFPGGDPVAGVQYNVVDRLPAWVVTYTWGEPEDMNFGARPDAPYQPILITHHHVVVDAMSGKLVLGFFTA